MSINKKIRKKVVVKNEPLSFLDSTLYFIYILLICAITCAPFVFSMVFCEQYAYSNEAVIAFDNDDQWELLFCLPCCLSLLFLFILPLVYLDFGTRPIFGNPKYKPKARESVIRKEPFTSKDFWRNLSSDTIDDVKKSLIGCFIAVLLSAPLLQLCVYPREVIESNDDLIRYNLLNQVSHSANASEANQLKIEIYKYSNGKNSSISHYSIELTILFEDTQYSFTLSNFKNMSIEETLRYMLHLKSYFTEEDYEIVHVDRMDKLIKDKDFSTTELDLIYELFDYR